MIYKFVWEMNQLIHIKSNCGKYSATKREKKKKGYFTFAPNSFPNVGELTRFKHLQSNDFSQYNLNKKQTSVEIVQKL